MINNGMIAATDGRHAVCVDKKNGHYGWVFYKHPDGLWVSLRKASEAELTQATKVADSASRIAKALGFAGDSLTDGSDCPTSASGLGACMKAPAKPGAIVEWNEAQRIANLPGVDEALRNFSGDATSDNATCLVRNVLEASADQMLVLEAWEAIGHDIGVNPSKDELLASLRHMASQPVVEMKSHADVLAERRRQVDAEGWTPKHDDEHDTGTLATAAGCYAMHTLAYRAGDPPPAWPWDTTWWKPSPDRRRNLIKAGALILAEIERIDRAAEKVNL